MSLDLIVDGFSSSLAKDAGVIFVGSGISAPSGLPTWPDLLKSFAAAIGIDLTNCDDLPSIAQFVINANGNNRGPLIHAIKENFIRHLPINQYHDRLRKTNIKTIWTTNYDTLLEQAFQGYIQDVKAHDDAIARGVSNHQIEIIKAHGCIATSQFKDLVVSLADYEDFFINRPATADRLRSDLLRKSFLFVGYGYGDPNIRNVLVEARRLANQATRQHFMIQKAEKNAELSIRQKHWIYDLKRVGISCVLINDYNELADALERIALKSRGRTLFATGGHELPLDNAADYGKAFASIPDLTLLDGQSEGVSRSIISSFTEECLRTRQDIRSRVRLFSNPYAIRAHFNNDPNLLPELKTWRAPLLRETQVMVVFPGGMGTEAEVEVAKMLGCYIIPVPLSKTDSAYNLIVDGDIKSSLQTRIPSYLEAAIELSVTPEIIKNSVSEILGV